MITWDPMGSMVGREMSRAARDPPRPTREKDNDNDHENENDNDNGNTATPPEHTRAGMK